MLEEDYLALYKRNQQYVQKCIAPAFGSFLCYGQVRNIELEIVQLMLSLLETIIVAHVEVFFIIWVLY